MFQGYALQSANSVAGQQTAIQVEATTGDKFVYTCDAPCRIKRVGVRLTATAGTLSTSTVVSFDKRTVYDSDSGRAELDTITIPTGTTAGTILYADVRTTLLPSQQLVVEQKTQGVGTTDGDWLPYIIVEPIDEVPGNCTYMTASA